MFGLFDTETRKQNARARLVRDLVREAKEGPRLNIEVRDNDLDIRIRHEPTLNVETGELR